MKRPSGGRTLKPRSERPPLNRSEMMSRIRSANTTPERRVAAQLQQLGHAYRRNAASLPGRPDFSNRTRQWAIFVHGCFWHSHQGCALASSPKSNQGYWVPKLQRTKERDAKNSESLRGLGLAVGIIWECQTRSDAELKEWVERFFASLKVARRQGGC